jgi:hypothetical protein
MDRPAMIAWIDPAHAPGVADAASRAGFDLRGVGTPARGRTQSLADELGCEPLPDLRSALASTDARLVLVTAPPEAGRSAPIDARTVLAAETRGVRLATMIPFPASLMDAAEGGLLRDQAGQLPADMIHLVPRARRHPVFQASNEVVEAFAPVAMVTVEMHAPPAWGGLAAAWLGATDAVLALVGMPELVDASSMSTGRNPGDWTGQVAALLRFPDGRAGQVTVSDRGSWGWRITLRGEQGSLTLRPSGFDWLGPEGDRRDQHRADPRWTEPGEVLAGALRELIDPAAPRGPATRWSELLATAEAALLSTRTGQGEATAMLLRAASASVHSG